MTLEEQELVKVVVEDLSYLRETWDESISDSSLRRESSILRILLVENKVSQAWRLLGFSGEPKVSAFVLDDALAETKRAHEGNLTYVQVGGARANGAVISHVLMYDIALPDSQMQALTSTGEPIKSEMTISRYMKSPCIRANLKNCSLPDMRTIFAFNRQELVQYVANKLGGAHIDTARDKSKVLEKKFIALDMIKREVGLLGKPAVYYEILSIGQALNDSADIRLLIAKASEWGLA